MLGPFGLVVGAGECTGLLIGRCRHADYGPAMCGRYVLREVIKLREKLEKLRTRKLGLEVVPRFNVAPTQEMPVVINDEGPAETRMRWGPMYPLAAGKPGLLVNARSETVAAKSLFRDSLRRRRCLIPADGFYEWHRLAKVKLPYLFERRDGATFWMAGLYEEAAGDVPRSFLVLTTGPNEVMAPVHDRMPVMLDDAAAAEWLAPGAITAARVQALCVPFPAAAMTARRVGTLVNSARFDSPACLEPPGAEVVPPETGELRFD